MNWLRLILLIAGLLFIAGLVWRERRRNRNTQDASGGRASERSEPVLELPAEQDAGAAAPPLSPRGPDPGRLPPVIDWSSPASAAEPVSSAMPGSDSGSDLVSTGDYESEPALPTEAAAATNGEHWTGRAFSAQGGDNAESPALIIDWPEESQRHIVSLRIVPARHDRLSGRALRQALAGCGFRHGQFGIFHLPAEDGRVVLSAASLVRPGLLDPTSMDYQRFTGINLFTVLPGPLSAELTLEQLAAIAGSLALRVEGQVQDEHGEHFDTTDCDEWNQRCLAAISAPPARSAGHPD
jgi:FtsZ-interacting cell division protein ZipA